MERSPNFASSERYSRTAIGLHWLIALLILALTVARYWHAIHWSMR